MPCMPVKISRRPSTRIEPAPRRRGWPVRSSSVGSFRRGASGRPAVCSGGVAGGLSLHRLRLGSDVPRARPEPPGDQQNSSFGQPAKVEEPEVRSRVSRSRAAARHSANWQHVHSSGSAQADGIPKKLATFSSGSPWTKNQAVERFSARVKGANQQPIHRSYRQRGLLVGRGAGVDSQH